MGDSRFEDLTGRLLDDDLDGDGWTELLRLIREDPGLAEDLRDQLAAAEMLVLSEDVIRQGPLFLSATRSRLGDDAFLGRVRRAISAGPGPRGGIGVPRDRARMWPTRRDGATAALAILALVATWFLLWPKTEPAIARITELNGSLVWTGDGGRVMRELRVGMALGGGTLDALTSGSWAALEFRDGTSVTLSGPSMLTISDRGQKELYLREGELFARVARQAPGQPMLIHTRTAEMQVLGTRLNVEAGSSETRLSVDEGRVRMTRLVDGSVAEVAARHRVVATADRSEALTPTIRPEPVDRWESDLSASMGKLLPPEGPLAARLRALPIVFNRPKEGPLVLYVAGFGAARCGSSPVILGPDSRFSIRGAIGSAREVHFGITMKKPEGAFGGKFEVAIPAAAFREHGGPFAIEIRLGDMRPQPHARAGSPIGSELQDCYLYTTDVDAGLEVMRVGLHPSGPGARNGAPAPASPPG